MTCSNYLPSKLKLLTVVFFVAVFQGGVKAQEVLLPSSAAAEEKPSILVIPFEPKLYMSEIDRHLNAESKLNFQELRNVFRNGIELQATYVFKKKFEVLTISDGTEMANKEFGYVYSSIGYDYRTVPAEPKPEPTGIDKIKANAAELLKQKEAEKETAQNNSRTQNGQIQKTKVTPGEKFMAVSVINPKLFSDLKSKHNADFVLFITQIDLKIPRNTDVRQLESDDYLRELKLHFSLFDADGKEIYAGAAIVTFSSKLNNPDKIVKTALKAAIEKIALHVPGFVDEPTEGQPVKEAVESDKTLNDDY